MEQCMEFDLSGIFPEKLVPWNKVHDRPQGPYAKMSLQCDVSFWRKIQIFWTRQLDFCAFLVKSFTSLIYVKQK